jgi:hypothetical protein
MPELCQALAGSITKTGFLMILNQNGGTPSLSTPITAGTPHPPTPPNPEYEAVLVRLGRLERQRFWLLFIACTALGFAGVGLVVNRPRPVPAPNLSEQVKAKEFLLESREGRRGLWGTAESESLMMVGDPVGQGIAVLSAKNGGGMLSLLNKHSNRPGVTLWIDKEDNTGLAFADRNGNTRLEMKANDQGSFLALFDKTGRKRIFLAVTELGPGIWCLDPAGKIVWGSP